MSPHVLYIGGEDHRLRIPAMFTLREDGFRLIAAASAAPDPFVPKAKRGFVLLPRRWVVERSFAWAARFRRLAKDYEVYAATLAGLHVVAFVCLMLARAVDLMQSA